MTAVFGAPEFKARSGRTVKPQEDGSIRFERAYGYLDRSTAMDAEEYFQAREDARRGRWRWPVNPDYVVYRRADGVIALNEQSGNTKFHAMNVNRPVSSSGRTSMLDQAISAFFGAHPVSPVAAAKPGEVWELTIDDGSTHSVFVHEDRNVGGRAGVSPGGAYFDIEDSSHIVSARFVCGAEAAS